MAVFDDPCSCCKQGAANTELTFRDAVLKILCKLLRQSSPVTLGRINETTSNPATDEEILAAPGEGFAWALRSAFVNSESTSTTFKIGGKDDADVVTYYTPVYNFLSNAGVVLPDNTGGWFIAGENESLVITTTDGAVDILGTAEKVAV